MTIELTLTLPDSFVERAQQWATYTNCDVADIITGAARLSLPPLITESTDLDVLTDAQVLALSYLQMDPEDEARLSALLDLQQARPLNPEERAELDKLMSYYKIGLLRKAEALAEAVQRGLREPLHS